MHTEVSSEIMMERNQGTLHTGGYLPPATMMQPVIVNEIYGIGQADQNFFEKTVADVESDIDMIAM